MTTRSQQTRSTACSLQSHAVGEPIAGTAPIARAWIVIEHPGPWGRQAVEESDLPDSVKANLATAKEHHVTVLLARRPDLRANDGAADASGHRVWVARCGAGGARLRTATLPTLDPVGRWDLAAIAEGSLPVLDGADDQPLLLVCTNAKRDVCCAIHGRALLAGLWERATPAQKERIWECSHLGGHRFAPVTVTLPDGMVHGRLSVDDVPDLLESMSTRRVLAHRLRGRSCLPAALQAAEVAVRLDTGLADSGSLDVLAGVGGRTVPVSPAWQPAHDQVTAEVRHADGRAWRVDLVRDRLTSTRGDLTEPVLRAESCGRDALPVTTWRPGPPRLAPSWR